MAVSATGVSKSFLLIDDGDALQIAFGDPKKVERFQALRNITLRAQKGQFIGILGRNGAGKTTLLRTLGGVFAPDAGEVEVTGELSAIYELGVAGNPFLTGRQYAERMLVMRGLPAHERAEMLEDVIEFSELGERIDDRIQSYSTGMSARLFFAVATAGFYDVYLIDEVLAVGDQYFQAKCWRRIKSRLERGASGVLVTHDWTTILKVCSQAHIIEGGVVTHSGAPEVVVRRYLYGDDLTEPYERGVARIVAKPEIVRVPAGGRLEIPFEVEIEKSESVYAVAVIEQMRTGIGWETMLMSREPIFIGDRIGRSNVMISLDATPLPPGEYVLGGGLVQQRGPNEPRRLFDGFGWLSGSGVPIVVIGDRPGASLPARWELNQ